jgi:hypothetical protein
MGSYLWESHGGAESYAIGERGPVVIRMRPRSYAPAVMRRNQTRSAREGSHQPQPEGQRDGLRPALDVEFGENVG